jgi:hypothetical protein
MDEGETRPCAVGRMGGWIGEKFFRGARKGVAWADWVREPRLEGPYDRRMGGYGVDGWTARCQGWMVEIRGRRYDARIGDGSHKSHSGAAGLQLQHDYLPSRDYQRGSLGDNTASCIVSSG